MKKPKPKKSEVRTVEPFESLEETKEIENFHAAENKKANAELPTPAQLAMIAATLARNANYSLDALAVEGITDGLAEAAMYLWLSSRKQILTAAADEEVWNQDYDFEHPFERNFPMKRDEFLRLNLPKYKNRTADLARIGKDYLRGVLLKRDKKEPTPEEVADAYGGWKDYENEDQLQIAMTHFDLWYRDYVKDARRAAGLKSAAERQTEKKVEKKALNHS
jgi:hypothetical protein